MSARKEKLFWGLMTRVDGRGRLIPTPTLSKIMLHLVAGGLGGPLLKTVHCIVKFNEPATVTVTVCHCHYGMMRTGGDNVHVTGHFLLKFPDHSESGGRLSSSLSCIWSLNTRHLL